MHVETMCASSSHAESISGELTTAEDVIVGGTFQAAYFNSAQTQALGVPDRPVVHMVDGVLTDVFIIDIDDPQVKQINDGQMSGKEKRDNIARVQLIKHFS
jgi:hypothetical protein